jgi:hypothetical protein
MAVSGIYKTAASSPMGKAEGTLVLTAEGDALTGLITGMGATIGIHDGKVSGDCFEFEVEVTTPMGKMKVTVKGAVDGDRIFGNLDATFGQMPFEGTRIE